MLGSAAPVWHTRSAYSSCAMSYPMDAPYWYYLECPLAGDCSHELWKKWKVWGYTELDAQQQLFKHFNVSGKHFCSPHYADEVIAESTSLVFDPGAGASAGLASSASTASAASRPLAIGAEAAADAGAIGARPPSLESRPTKQRRGTHHAAAAANFNMIIDSVQRRIAPTVTLRMQEFNTIIDSVQRSFQAAKSAAQIAGNASASFTAEFRTLDKMATTMIAMRTAAEFSSAAD